MAAEPSATVEPKSDESVPKSDATEIAVSEMGETGQEAQREASRHLEALYSWYNPALGGSNCATFVNGECVSRMASGERWQDWIDQSPGAVACPARFPFWTEIRYAGQRWYCLDRGSAIVGNWLDFLVSEPHTGFGELVEVEVTWPE